MADFYTVDRAATLQAGQVLRLTKFSDVNPPELQAHVDTMFPEGVSNHGDQYFLKNTSRPAVASPAIELLFEYVRRSAFATCPSRFQAWYGAQSIADARVFRTRFGAGGGTIWRVSADDSFVGNMNLLTHKDSLLVHSWRAHVYWKGEAGPDTAPFWEFLLIPPIIVIERVD